MYIYKEMESLVVFQTDTNSYSLNVQELTTTYRKSQLCQLYINHQDAESIPLPSVDDEVFGYIVKHMKGYNITLDGRFASNEFLVRSVYTDAKKLGINNLVEKLQDLIDLNEKKDTRHIKQQLLTMLAFSTMICPVIDHPYIQKMKPIIDYMTGVLQSNDEEIEQLIMEVQPAWRKNNRGNIYLILSKLIGGYFYAKNNQDSDEDNDENEIDALLVNKESLQENFPQEQTGDESQMHQKFVASQEEYQPEAEMLFQGIDPNFFMSMMNNFSKNGSQEIPNLQNDMNKPMSLNEMMMMDPKLFFRQQPPEQHQHQEQNQESSDSDTDGDELQNILTEMNRTELDTEQPNEMPVLMPNTQQRNNLRSMQNTRSQQSSNQKYIEVLDEVPPMRVTARNQQVTSRNQQVTSRNQQVASKVQVEELVDEPVREEFPQDREPVVLRSTRNQPLRNSVSRNQTVASKVSEELQEQVFKVSKPVKKSRQLVESDEEVEIEFDIETEQAPPEEAVPKLKPKNTLGGKMSMVTRNRK
jgi:hypothetical protein